MEMQTIHETFFFWLKDTRDSYFIDFVLPTYLENYKTAYVTSACLTVGLEQLGVVLDVVQDDPRQVHHTLPARVHGSQDPKIKRGLRLSNNILHKI